jgi:catechol 2,3-dioxygenase-like lactoylglutathione lyase family enzyme
LKCRIGEVNIISTDAERSLRFYRDLLGFEVVRQEKGAYHMRCGATKFLLLPVAESENDRRPYCTVATVSVDILVGDIREAVERMREAGVEFASEWKPGDSHVFIRAPDGLVLEVIETSEGV